MSSLTDHLDTPDIIEHVFAASTLEDAIFWREAMRSKLQILVDQASQPNGLSPDEIALHRTAQLHIDISLAHLRLSLVNKERIEWQPETHLWVARTVWQDDRTAR